jgi:hypothetical protein
MFGGYRPLVPKLYHTVNNQSGTLQSLLWKSSMPSVINELEDVGCIDRGLGSMNNRGELAPHDMGHVKHSALAFLSVAHQQHIHKVSMNLIKVAHYRKQGVPEDPMHNI